MSQTPIELKGITQQNLPPRLKMKLSAAEQEAYVERFRVVATDPELGPIIREELDGVLLAKLSPAARRVAGLLLFCAPAVRLEVLGCFDAKGDVQYPWALELEPPVKSAPPPTTVDPPVVLGDPPPAEAAPPQD